MFCIGTKKNAFMFLQDRLLRLQLELLLKNVGASPLQAKWDLQYAQILRQFLYTYRNSHNESFADILAKVFLLNWLDS